MSSDIQIVPLSRSSRDVMRFLKVSYGIYGDDPQLGGAAADGPEEGVHGRQPAVRARG